MDEETRKRLDDQTRAMGLTPAPRPFSGDPGDPALSGPLFAAYWEGITRYVAKDYPGQTEEEFQSRPRDRLRRVSASRMTKVPKSMGAKVIRKAKPKVPVYPAPTSHLGPQFSSPVSDVQP